MGKPEAGKIVVLETKEEFDAFLKDAGSTLVVVDFFAEWCGPCKKIKPTFVRFAEEFAGKAFFAKVDVDDNGETAEAEEISAMPTFKLYKNGEKVTDLTGADEKKLKALIEANA